MCSNECLQRLFVNLRVVSQVQPGDKLSTCYENFHITVPLYYTPATRWLYGDSRRVTLEQLDKNITCAAQFCQRAITSEILKRRSSDMKDMERLFLEQSDIFSQQNQCTSFNMDNETLLRYMKDLLSSTSTGLSNLKDTYTDDSTTSAKIDIMIDSIQRQISAIDTYFDESGDKKMLIT